ncbi:hypothetical protein D3C81_1584670 [compost metagenome]
MRGAHRFVQIKVHNVKAHVAGAGDAHDRVGVGAVIIQQTAGFMHNLGDLYDLFLEQAQRVRVGEHQRSRVFADSRSQRVQVHHAARGGRDGHRLEPGDRGAGGVRAVRGVRHDHLGAFLAAAFVVGADHHQAGPFAMGPGRGLQRHLVHTGESGQVQLQAIHQL